MHLRHKSSAGFTVLELAVVIVVVAILAVLTIVGYGAIRQRAITAAIESDLNQAKKSLHTWRLTRQPGQGSYPTNLAQIPDIAASSGNVFTYRYFSTTNEFCLQATNANINVTKHVTNSDEEILDNACGVTANMTSQWKLNGNGTDTTGAINGTLESLTSATGQGGTANTAYTFNGTSSGISVSTSNLLTPTPAATYSFWVKPANWTSATASAFIAKRSGSGLFILYLNGTATLNVDVGTSTNRWNTGYAPPIGTWTLITITIEPNLRKLYVNGNFQSQSTATTATMTSAATMTIGREASVYRFAGDMDDIRIFNRAVTAAEAATLFQYGAD